MEILLLLGMMCFLAITYEIWHIREDLLCIREELHRIGTELHRALDYGAEDD